MPIKPFRPQQRLVSKTPPKKYMPDDDYDYEDDLPQITTKKDVQQPNLLSDYSYEESYESYSSGENWKSKTPTPVHRMNVAPSPKPPNRTPTGPVRPIPSGRNSRPLPRSMPSKTPPPTPTIPTTPVQNPPPTPAEIDDGYSNDYSNESNESNENIQPMENQTPQKSRQAPVSNEMPDDHQLKQNEEPEPADSNLQKEVDNKKLKEMFENPPKTTIPQPENIPVQVNDVEEQTFQIVYEQKNLGKFWKRHVQMTKDDVLIYICKSIKQKPYGKVHVICTKKPVELGSPYYAGKIIRHQSGSRFTLYGKADDVGLAEPQIAGISFVNLKSNARIRMFRVALPAQDNPYTPSEKKDDLSRIAAAGDPVPNVQIFSSALPVKKEDGTLSLYFGPYSIVRSTKNFLVRAEDGSNIFTIFKTFDGICTLKVKQPFTPLIGFAVAVAISTSTK